MQFPLHDMQLLLHPKIIHHHTELYSDTGTSDQCPTRRELVLTSLQIHICSCCIFYVLRSASLVQPCGGTPPSTLSTHCHKEQFMNENYRSLISMRSNEEGQGRYERELTEAAPLNRRCAAR